MTKRPVVSLVVLLVAFGAYARPHRKAKPEAPESQAAALKSDTLEVKRAPNITPEKKNRGFGLASNDNNGNGNGNGSDNGNNGNAFGHDKDHGKPVEIVMKHAGSSKADLRTLPQVPMEEMERPELEEPQPNPVMVDTDGVDIGGQGSRNVSAQAFTPHTTVQAPATIMNFAGLDFQNFGNGHPPDTNGDVGRDYYIQTINTSLGIFRKSDGVRVAAFSFNTFMSQGHFGNLCDTNNFGDPVVLYDSFEDRWIITDFAFQLSGGNVVNPPGSFQCVAASMTGDPVSGGWNFYSINTAGGLGDYPKFGIWPDGLYMSANMFTYVGSSFITARAYAFNKQQMYAGSPTVQVLSFDIGGGDFTVIPANARLQAGTPPSGSPNYFISTWQFLNAVGVYTFHVDWNNVALSSLNGPFLSVNSFSSWPNASVANAPSLGGNALDVLQIRAMMQNQYTNLGGAESLWVSHTVRRQNTTGFAAPRWYQVGVNNGVVAPLTTQGATFDPDGANVINRFMPSLAVDRAGDMAIGYSTSSSTTKPAIKYAGRLAGDPINTLNQTEQVLVQGTGTQTGNCGTSTCIRWGDYSAMTLDPDGCTFWNTNMYYLVDGLNHQTRIGSFRFPSCITVGGGGSVSGTVTVTPGGAPLAGATVALGSRVTTANGSGAYAFLNLPAGTYPTISASFPGYGAASASSIAVTDGGTTTQNFALAAAATNACLTDTTQADFFGGIPSNVDLTSTPGSVTLVNAPTINQQNTSLGTSGFNVTTTQWIGQTFTPTVTGPVPRIDVNLFCGTCSGANPPVTIDIRATSGGLPTSTIIASTTIAGFSSGASSYYTATFSPAPTLNAGTQYAIMTRLTTARSAGNYDATFSTANPYPGGVLVFSTTGGASFSSIAGDDLGFKVYFQLGFNGPGTFTSSMKDANPPAGASPVWTTLSWNASTPAGTNVTFQAAVSNSPFGPFTFVGPDSTPATTFSNGASLSQFNGFRYLRYQATLTTTSGAVTPSLNDATVCFIDTLPTALSVAPASGTYGGTTSLSATLTSLGNPVSGKTISFTIDGNPAGSAVTNGSGVASLTGVALGTLSAGNHNIVGSLAGDNFYFPATGTNTLSIAKANATIAVTPYSVVYNAAPHTATGSATGVFGESLAGLDLSGTTHTNAGSYVDGWTFSDVTGNYNGASGSVTDSIAQAVLTVTANNASRLYGQPNPTFTASYSGFQGGDTFASSVTGAPSLTTTAAQFSAVGAYTITASIGTLASGNYSFTFVNGTLTIYLTGLVGVNSVKLGGFADSFDSSVGYPASAGSNMTVLSNGTIEIMGAHVNGNLLSTGSSITLQPNTIVNGNVVAGTTVSNKGTVNGTITQNQSAAALVAPAVADCGAFTLSPNLSGSFTYSGGDLKVTGAASIGSGTYCFHSLTINGGAVLAVGGPVSISLTGTLSAGGGSFANTTHVPANLQIASSYAGSNGVSLNGGAEAFLTLYAPKTDVTITGNSSLFGAVLGKTLTASGTPDVHYDSTIGNIWTLFFGF